MRKSPSHCKKWKRKVGYSDGEIYQADCLQFMKSMPDDAVDLIISSPPYEEARLYLENGEDLGIARKTEDWVAWMIDIMKESLRVCKGVVAYVVGHGSGAKSWSGAPALLCADLIRAGINLRSPLWYHRNGIMGSGGDDWFRADIEWIVCASKNRKLSWSDNTACGHPPKCGAGGAISHRNKDGTRMSDKNRGKVKDLMKKEGISQREAVRRLGLPMRTAGTGMKDGDVEVKKTYVPPEKSNPGTVITCGAVGGGHLGSNIAHENEAPFPIKIPDFFIRSLCPPDGIVFDPFLGSGTTVAAAILTGRRFLGCDLRSSQVDLSKRRIKQARQRKGLGI